MEKAPEHKLLPVETKDGSLTLHSERFEATYHAMQGAKEECLHVFIRNGLLEMIRRRPQQEYRLLEIGFGTGLNALLTWLVAQERQISVDFHTVEYYPVGEEAIRELSRSNFPDPGEKAVYEAMHRALWDRPHELSANFRLRKHLAKIEEFSSEERFDLIYFDAFSPKEQPELWTEAVFRNMFSLLGPGGMLVTYCAQGQMKRNLKAAGFRVKALQGFAGKREMTVAEKSLD